MFRPKGYDNMENIEYCISLCEVLISAYYKDSTYETVIKQSCDKAGYSDITRIYVGSNFCSQYFCNCKGKVYESILSYCKNRDLKVTLCIPIFSQKDLNKAKNIINELSCYFHSIIDEITVNDYGMLSYIKSEYSDMKINLGRLMNKESRDVRYPEYNEGTYTPKFLSLDASNCCNCSLNSIELDPVMQNIDLTGADIKCAVPAIYIPYCYVTVGQMCEFASIPLPIEKKFRPNSPCNSPCAGTFITYDGKGNTKYAKVGRAVYFKQENVSVKGIEKYREIYQPFEVFGVNI